MTTSPHPVGWYRLRTEGLVWHDVDGRIFLLDDAEQVYLTINDSGAVLWRRLVTGATADDLVAELVREYQIDVATATADMERFIDSLVSHGLVDIT